jgi:hypothetical protein
MPGSRERSAMIDFLSHHPDYSLPLPIGHPFPSPKYALVHQYLLERGIVSAERLHAPEEAAF